jgi:glucose-6-phosphate dehydrogenase assembly protein OpcA
VDLRYEERGLAAALLLAGWIIGRAGWQTEGMARRNGHAHLRAVRPDGAEVAIRLHEARAGQGCGGVDALTFCGESAGEEVAVSRSGATSSLRDLFAASMLESER